MKLTVAQMIPVNELKYADRPMNPARTRTRPRPMKTPLSFLAVMFAAVRLIAPLAIAQSATTETSSPARDEAAKADADGSARLKIAGEAKSPAIDERAAKPVADIYPRWSIVGDWRVTHPDWTGILTIHPDGRVSNTISATGRWTLTAQGGTPLLVIRWDAFGTESLDMVTPDHFRGQNRKRRFTDIHRVEAKAAAAGAVEAK